MTKTIKMRSIIIFLLFGNIFALANFFEFKTFDAYPINNLFNYNFTMNNSWFNMFNISQFPKIPSISELFNKTNTTWEQEVNLTKDQLDEITDKLNKTNSEEHKLIDYFHNISNKTNTTLGNVQFGISPTYRAILSTIPGFNKTEHILCCFVFQTLDLTLRVIVYEQNETKRAQLVKNVTLIVMENISDPLLMSIKLFDFSLKYHDITIMNLTERIKIMIKLNEWIVKVLKLFKRT